VAQSWGSDGIVLSAEGNVGYGRGHNLGARSSNAKYHLVLNPDVTLNEEALTHAVEYMEAHPLCGMLGPKGSWSPGERQYLVKRYPSVLDLAVRAWAPEWLKRQFSTRLDRYEMRNEAEDMPLHKVPIISGCFMFARKEAFNEVGGFSDAFFLYFEDFDLSLRIGDRWDVAYVPAVQIEHAGGQAGRKGLRHIALFVTSAMRFFSIHGWKWW
jgi:GT2 family glycosyltransferase